MDLRRYLLPALILLACDDDEPETVALGGGSIDAATDAYVNPEQDATCETSMLSDLDGDGFSRARGDCNDCDPDIGPASYDFPGNGIDEDCSGADATLADLVCDTDLEDDDTDPQRASRAFGLCGALHSTASGYQGLLDVSFARLDASKQGLADVRQLWLPEAYGDILPRQGARLMAISTGVARDVNDRDYTQGCDTFTGTLTNGVWSGGATPPKGFPKDSKACGTTPISQGALAYDDVVVQLSLRAPSNASAFAFDSLFLTYEYPDYVCTRFNDFFVVLMDPAPSQADDDDNIMFDANDDPVGVNSALLSVCQAASQRRTTIPIACSQGPSLLKTTGYGVGESTCGEPRNGTDIGGASTGWLHTEMPVHAGHLFTLTIALWDSSDPLLDSTVLLDNFRWLQTTPTGNTAPISSN